MPPPPAPANASDPAAAGARAGQPVILFVDDEPQSCKWFARTFADEFNVLTATGVDEALVVDAVAATVTGTLASAKAFVKLVGLPPDRRTALRGTASRRKRLVWSDPIDLSALKRTAHAAGVTVNDLLLTAVS